MSKQFWRTLALTVAAILTSLLLVVGQTLLTSATIPRQQAIAQLTSISQLSDVRPTDYYYPALQSLVEQYGCMAGSTDRTFLHRRVLQSAELVGIINACMDRVNELVSATTAGIPKAEDLGTMRKLLNEIINEVSSIRR